jgi:hypothetical protein
VNAFEEDMGHSRSTKSAEAILRLPIENDQDFAQTRKIIPVLNGMKGVFSVRINHVTNMISIECDDQEITLEEIRNKISEIILHRSSTKST